MTTRRRRRRPITDAEALKLVNAVFDQRLRDAVPDMEESFELAESWAIDDVLRRKDRGPLARLLRRGVLGPKGRAFAADLLEGRVKIGVGRPRGIRRSPSYFAARELPYVLKVLREQYGHAATREWAIRITALRKKIPENKFRNYLKSRHCPKKGASDF